MCFLITFGILISLFFAGAGETGVYAEVTVDHSHYGTYDLGKDGEYPIEKEGHRNVLKIENGQISMIEANCPNRQCMEQGAISHSKQTIVCLPNRVLVEIKGPQEGAKYDAIAY